MEWRKFESGPRAGKTLPQLVLQEPGWFFWCWGKDYFSRPPELKKQAAAVADKARRIRIPKRGGKRQELEFYFHGGKLHRVVTVPASKPDHEGSSVCLRYALFDLSATTKLNASDL